MSQDDRPRAGSRRRFLFRATASAIAAGAVFPACGMSAFGVDGRDAGNDGGRDGVDGGLTPSDGGTTGSETGACVEFATGVRATELAVGETRVLTGPAPQRMPIVLGRDAQGLYAMNGECTHEQCPVVRRPGGSDFDCSCMHGSRFSLTGELTQPATLRAVVQGNLPHLQLTLRDGQLVVCTTAEVPRTSRVTA
ncbi:MAG: Rieske 2Fe-2S domain-containing protein [Deltaproteobacteria bacterium]|nr:Rieske 2Fe-2S domain-containing protein [Deltaproteobacteria bacterium]